MSGEKSFQYVKIMLPLFRAVVKLQVCMCRHTCKIPSTNDKSLVQASLSTVQQHKLTSTFVVASATQEHSLFQIQKFWTARAIPNTRGKLLVQTKAHARNDAFPPIAFSHGLTIHLAASCQTTYRPGPSVLDTPISSSMLR